MKTRQQTRIERITFFLLFFLLLSTQSSYAYIDPGTGSMLFTLMVSIIGSGIYWLRSKSIKLRFILHGGKTETTMDSRSFVIYSDHKRYWNVFEPICNEFERRKINITYLTSSKDDKALTEPYEYVDCRFIDEGNRAFATLNTLRAQILLSTTPSLDVFNWKRSKGVDWYVHIPHAPSDLTLYRMFGIDYYDAILTSGDYHEEQIRALERLRNLPEKEIVKTGLTFMDEIKVRIDREKKKNSDNITVLLAPSWGKSSLLNVFGTRLIDQLIKTGYQIIIRPHPQSYENEKELIAELREHYDDNDRVQWNRDNDNYDILNRADILISDFSGVIFDFCLAFDKPVIYADTDFDKSPYDAWWLDEEPWTFRILPEIGEELREDNLNEIKKMIDRCLTDNRYQQGRNKAREETWAHMGESTERVVDYLVHKQLELSELKTNEIGSSVS